MSKTYQSLVGLHFVLCTLAMIWPIATLANRVEPQVFGLPFLFFWYVLWMGLLFVGMWVAFVVQYGGSRYDD